MKYDGILFDLDGTLWDAAEPIARSWRIALQDIPDVEHLPTLAELKSVMGMTAVPLVEKLFPYLSTERGLELFERCCQVENEYLRKNGGRLYDGIETVLKELSKKVPLFIVSNCNKGYIPAFLEAHGLSSYFKDWECSGETGLQKCENIQLVVQRNQLKAPVYIGDTEIDRDAAAKANVPFLHAGYGFGKVSEALHAKTPLELLTLLEQDF